MPQLTDRGYTQAPAYDFAGAVSSRMPLIDDLGVSQNNYVQEAAQRRLALQQAQQQSALTNAQSQSNQIGQSNSSKILNSGSQVTGTLNKLKEGIRQQESGGNYRATNKTSGAAGAYQIMPSNIMGTGKGWDYEALGRDVNLGEFYADAGIQDKIATYKLQQYLNAYGPAGAAIAWYAGPGAAQKYSNSGRVSTSSQGAYPTVSSYMQQILRRMGL